MNVLTDGLICCLIYIYIYVYKSSYTTYADVAFVDGIYEMVTCRMTIQLFTVLTDDHILIREEQKMNH